MTEFVPRPFPTFDTLIAPFWSDVDTRDSTSIGTDAGTITYGTITESSALAMAATQIRRAFPAHSTFTPTYLYITTWEDVAYFDQSLVSDDRVSG